MTAITVTTHQRIITTTTRVTLEALELSTFATMSPCVCFEGRLGNEAWTPGSGPVSTELLMERVFLRGLGVSAQDIAAEDPLEIGASSTEFVVSWALRLSVSERDGAEKELDRCNAGSGGRSAVVAAPLSCEDVKSAGLWAEDEAGLVASFWRSRRSSGSNYPQHRALKGNSSSMFWYLP